MNGCAGGIMLRRDRFRTRLSQARRASRRFSLFALRAALVPVVLGGLILGGCAEPAIKPSEQHIQQPAPRPGGIPELARPPLPLPAPQKEREERFDVSVENVSVRSLLFAMARDGKFDLNLAPDVDGQVTLQARGQTIKQIMERLAKQVDLRWEIKGRLLVVERDTPFLRSYRIDYVNLSRESDSTINVASQVGAGSGGASGGSGASGGAAGNASQTSVKNKNEHKFWETLVENVKDLLRETDKILPEGSSPIASPATPAPTAPSTGQPPATGAPAATAAAPAAVPPAAAAGAPAATPRLPLFREAASVIANPISGLLMVRATARQHEKVREFLDSVQAVSRRQVLIEATVVEVTLNKQHQTGIDWRRLALGAGFSFGADFTGATAGLTGNSAALNSNLVGVISGIQGDQNLTPEQKALMVDQIAKGFSSGAAGAIPPLSLPTGNFPLTGDTRGFSVGYGNGENFTAALKLLGQYGDVRVVSSPKVTTLNNQAAVLRVVDNLVYFTLSANTATTSGTVQTTYTSTPNTVAVGLVMSVLPQIDDGNVVLLNVRPTITRLRGYVRDPHPALQQVGSFVPIIQTKELESIMKVPSGQVVMLGGLMEDSLDKGAESLPGLEENAAAGLFGTRNSRVGKSELVIFLRPVVINDPSLDGDYAAARGRLPNENFFVAPPHWSANK